MIGIGEGGAVLLRNEQPRLRSLRRPILVETLVLAVAWLGCFWVYHGYAAQTAGGADPYGYVSEALRLSNGHFVERERVLSLFGVPEDSALTHPLGYAPSGPDGTVPTYPFGYPLLLALAFRLGGLPAAFGVTPLLGASTVLLTYLLGRSLLGRLGGALAAGMVALLPNFLWSVFMPMSDVPATFFAALALGLLVSRRFGPWGALGVGVAEGFGIWVRPNLALLLIPTVGWLLWRRDARRLLGFGLGLAPFLATEGAVNLHLYGAAWRTGYGDQSFAGLDGAFARGLRYLGRLQDQQAGIGLVLLGLGIVANRLRVAQRILLLGVAGSFLVFFSFYPIDDAWWYGRFVLPAFPAVALLEAGGVLRLLSPVRLRPVAVALPAAGMAWLGWSSVGYARAHDVFTIARFEHRYQEAAALVAGHVPGPALILAMQHSGSIRLYGGYPSARYDLGDAAELLSTLQAVRRNGGAIYLLVDDSEVATIEQGDRGILLAGAQVVGRAGPSDDPTTLFRLAVPPPPSELRAQHPAGVDFGGEIRLQGFDLSASSLRPGQGFTVTLYWVATQPPTSDYSVFVHVDDPTGRTVTQSDSLPAALPPTRWPVGFVVADVHRLTLPRSAAAGPLRVIAGLYRKDTLVRLWPSDAGGRLPDNFVPLGRVDVAGR